MALKKRRTKIAIPAIRLPDGEILKGHPHTILALRAIESGYTDGLCAGFIDDRELFRPIYPTPDFVFRHLLQSDKHAIKLTRHADWRLADALKAHYEAGREDHDFLKIFLDRWDLVCKLPIKVAARCVRTGKIFTGPNIHPGLYAFYPHLIRDETERPPGDYNFEIAEPGWVHFDGRFFSRKETGRWIKKKTGYCTNKENALSGEEFVPKLETIEDAKYHASCMHEHGIHHIRLRINMFTTQERDPDHVYLLKRLIAEYQRLKELEQSND